MAETEKAAGQQKASEQPVTASTVQAPRPGAQPSPGESSGGVFGDGSTQAQQDQLVRDAEEANAAVKKLADAEREARGS
jgi:hypothetical protein